MKFGEVSWYAFHISRRQIMLGPIKLTVLLLVALAAAAAGGEDPPVVAKITVSSSPAASTLGVRLVEGVMTFRGGTYLLTLRGSAAASSVGSVSNLTRVRDIEGVYRPADGELRNDAGVRLRFDPPLPLRDGQVQIEIASRIYPKVSTGQGNSVE